MMKIKNMDKKFEMFLGKEWNKTSRQQQKLQELGKITTVCLKKNRGLTTNSFYECLRDEAQLKVSTNA